MATTQPTTDTSAASTPYDRAKLAADAADHAANKAALDEALLGKPTPSTPGKGSRKPASRTKAKPATKGTKAKAAGTKPATKKGVKPAKPAKPRKTPKAATAGVPSKRKDEPIKGDLKGASLANYTAVLKVLPKLPAEAVNANAVAAKLSEKAGKTVWPIPTKRYLETAVARGDAVKFSDRGKALYHLPNGKGKGGK
ncbi:MAG TPA: hypothetical protein VL979_11265 [Solirubrobacteraceae bacterium]|nr:hypothetical protein [Solirubrobacteraceae bacterium]